MPHSAARARVTTETFTWRGIRCSVTHTRNHVNEGWSRLYFRVESQGPPVPITPTRTLIHDLDEDVVIAAGGTVPFMIAWLDRDALNASYAKALAAWKQFDLFGKP